MNAPSMLSAASTQWATRPNDQRFLDLYELQAKVTTGRRNSKSTVLANKTLEVQADPNDPAKGLQIVGVNGIPANFTNWSFGQMASLAGAPAGYLRKLDARLVADNMNYGIKINRGVEDIGLLLTKNVIEQPKSIGLGDLGGAGGAIGSYNFELRAATGPAYGRVWNSDIVDSLIEKFGDGRTGDFRVPGEFGKAVDVTRENTTIYGSDRDMFVFLADEVNRIEVPNRRNGQSGSLARGFFVWNSEVGSDTFGVAMFTFDYACSNRNVWGVGEYKEVRIRHTASAPTRWIEQVAPLLSAYAQSSAIPMQQAIAAAQAAKIDSDLDKFFKTRKFTEAQITGIKDAHKVEEDRPIETLWDASVAVSAYAKRIPWQDERVKIERRAGAFLELAAA